MQYEPVIGLEVHAQLLTRTKMFCGCPNLFGGSPNTRVCPVCSGMPGALPVLNKKAVELALRLAVKTGCAPMGKSIFARKNYFYPDLPKGYQISQYERPLCENGLLDIGTPDAPRLIKIMRIHLEEDAGKSIHDKADETLVDFNRCGTPLVEIVTEPDLKTPAEAVEYLVRLKQILQYLEVCDGNMEEGSLRCDANVSVRPVGQVKLGTKVEIKNMNSFKQVEKAIQYEIGRQIGLLESGGKVIQQTMLWDADGGTTRPMRDKEEANDYRYFPDPDLLCVVVANQQIEEVKKTMPETGRERLERFVRDYNLSNYDASVLTSSVSVSGYYDQTARLTPYQKPLANWITVEIPSVFKENRMEMADFIVNVPPKNMAEFIGLINSGEINNTVGKEVIREMAVSGVAAMEIIEKKGLRQITNNEEIRESVKSMIVKYPEQVQQFRDGKEKVFGFLVGEVMKSTKGKASPKIVNELLRNELSNKP